MKNLSTVFLLSALALAGCGGQQQDGIDFDSQPDGQRYVIGESFTEGQAVITVGGYYRDHGDVYDDGYALISGSCFYGTSTNQLSLSNVTADFDYPSSISGASIDFEYAGGDINLIINDELFVGTSFHELPASLGGVSVACSGSCDADGPGELTLTGTIDSLAIGGQELCVDNLQQL